MYKWKKKKERRLIYCSWCIQLSRVAKIFWYRPLSSFVGANTIATVRSMEQMAPIYPLNSTRSGNRVEVDDAFWKVSRVQSGERTHNSRISALFITRDAPAEARGCKVLKQQSSHEGMAFGTYCGTSPLRDSAGTCASPLHPSTLTATHLTPLTLTRGQAWHFDLWPLSLRTGTDGYIAICTVATINLPPSITALERDSAIYRCLLKHPRMAHAWIVLACLLLLKRASRSIRFRWIARRANRKIRLMDN